MRSASRLSAVEIGGVPDAVVHGETGLLVDPRSDSEVAEAIIRLLKNPDEARRLGDNGRRRVQNELTWEAVRKEVPRGHTRCARKAMTTGPEGPQGQRHSPDSQSCGPPAARGRQCLGPDLRGLRDMVIVDDCSSDETQDIIAGFSDPRIRSFRHDRNRGQSAAINTGIAHARGEYIGFLDDDDEWLPEEAGRTGRPTRSVLP